MANDRIKVVGYSQKVTLENNVEYRNFSPDLVGLQLANDGGTPLFTLGNFSITTNTQPKTSKIFRTTSFSNFVTLADLDLTVEQALDLLYNNAGVVLNLDKTKLSNYALFTSFREFVRVSLENIIINWPAAIYVTPLFSIPPDYVSQTGSTVNNYQYNPLTQKSTFSVNVNNFVNQYGINYLKNGDLSNTFNETNTLRNLTLNYTSYAILVNGVEYDILNFVGSSFEYNDFVYFEVKGDPFSNTTTGVAQTYHIKPNSVKENEFFNALPDFEYYLLNRLVTPKYTATFDFTIRTEQGIVIDTTESVTWPVSDGYNLDFTTDAYEEYARQLLEISDNFDLSTSNLMIRFLVSESITDFDTTAVNLTDLENQTADQKVNKTLTIYGREYDEINKFITGIKFANTVSYDKLNNTPDIYLKNIARVLGWELVSSVLENNLLKSYVTPQASTYLGQSVGLTAVEADIELWRRLILNSPWLWKSKGTRKGIEFLFKFIGTPLGLIQFNEYIYLAENKIDIELFTDILNINNLFTGLDAYPLTLSGYPKPFPNSPSLYYQSDGLWYRETGGPNSSVDITTGNNPHVGPYDGGNKYLNQFKSLIPNFTPTTISSQTVTINTTNIFTNYKLGTITDYTGATFVDITKDDGSDFSNAYVVDTTIILDPKKRKDESYCGCQTDDMLKSLSICIDKKEITPVEDCNFADTSTSADGTHYLFYPWFYDINKNKTNTYYETIFASTGCCINKGTSVHYNQVHNDRTSLGPFSLINSGYICCLKNPLTNEKDGDCGCFVTCNWSINNKVRTTAISGNTYLVFNDELGVQRTSSYNGCNCLANYTKPIYIRDPFTGELGYSCQLTTEGLNDINLTDSIIVKTYEQRVKGLIGCNEVLPKPNPSLPPRFTLVIVNDANQVGKTTNNIFFQSATNPSLGSNFVNANSALTASSSNGPQIGYMHGYIPLVGTSPEYNTNVEINVSTGLTPFNNVNLAFDPTKNKIGYLITTNEYDNTTIVSQLSSVNDLTSSITIESVTQNVGYYSTQYLLTNVGTPTNVYMVVDYRDLTVETNTPTTPTSPRSSVTLCHAISNQTGTEKTYNFRDVNNTPITRTINGNTTIYICAIQNSVSGENLLIAPTNNTCTSDIACQVFTPISNASNFVVINNTGNNIINSITANGSSLPGGRSAYYPLGPNGETISAIRNINTVVDRINVNVNAPISSKLSLYKGTAFLEQKTVNLIGGNTNNYNVLFSRFTFNSTDVLRIIFEDSNSDSGADNDTQTQQV